MSELEKDEMGLVILQNSKGLFYWELRVGEKILCRGNDYFSTIIDLKISLRKIIDFFRTSIFELK